MDELAQYLAKSMNLSLEVATQLAMQFAQGHMPFSPSFAASNEATAPTVLRGLQNPVKTTQTPPMAHLLPGIPGHAEHSNLYMPMTQEDTAISSGEGFRPNHMQVLKSAHEAYAKSILPTPIPKTGEGTGIDENDMPVTVGFDPNGSAVGVTAGNRRSKLKTYTSEDNKEALRQKQLSGSQTPVIQGPPHESTAEEELMDYLKDK